MAKINRIEAANEETRKEEFAKAFETKNAEVERLKIKAQTNDELVKTMVNELGKAKAELEQTKRKMQQQEKTAANFEQQVQAAAKLKATLAQVRQLSVMTASLLEHAETP